MTSLRPRLPLARGEWVALVLAVGIAHGFYARIVLYPSEFDARNYLDIATDIARQGLFSKYYYSNVRTYGYPLFLRVLRALTGGDAAAWQWLVFEVQLLLYLASALALRAAVAVRHAGFAPWLFGALALNVFALSFTPESLSESLSVTLISFAAAQWIRLRDDGSLPARVLAGSVLVGAAVMVRPANLYALAAWWIAVFLVVRERRVGGGALLAVVIGLALGCAAPIVPQVVNNMKQYDEPTPLVVSSLGRFQQIWGIWYLKYATALPPVPNPSIFYDNPFMQRGEIDEAHPLQWYVHHPGRGAATVALHLFNLTDPDLPFTYNRDLDPWYRIPLGGATHAAFALAWIAALLLWRERRDARVRTTALALLALVLAHLGIHATTAVEVRFGLPLLVLAPAMAVWWLRRRIDEGPVLEVRRAALWVLLYVVVALALSSWVRAQAPSIRAWQKAHASSAVAPPAVRRAAIVDAG